LVHGVSLSLRFWQARHPPRYAAYLIPSSPSFPHSSEARASIAKYLAFYNQGRPHSSLDGRTPDEAYFGTQAMVMAA
ncbi:integrase core domain-containing protein, partial [Bradyrhizobium liaoningense]|uniref:integrase core domain-containing protein n=1 Tax=Bradyrhizobium liaoningense TaxID=43992 RepID=UPI0024E05A7D